ncbi:hypothetical protein HYU13_01785, partial [Candidatus Woesearchaeota archaeon]|nr:hypothetical protein [Candidatus Woesearchaeota archaeon]
MSGPTTFLFPSSLPPQSSAERAPEKTLTRVIIDLGGNDVYQGPGALECAIFGIHYVLDFSGDDIYQTNGLGQGCGIFGIGVLEDISGNDIYSASVAGQGTALWGTGLLLDRDGDDV